MVRRLGVVLEDIVDGVEGAEEDALSGVEVGTEDSWPCPATRARIPKTNPASLRRGARTQGLGTREVGVLTTGKPAARPAAMTPKPKHLGKEITDQDQGFQTYMKHYHLSK